MYTIIAAFEITKPDTNKEKVLLLRNPWGSSTYSNDWHRNDARWTTATIAEVPYGINPITDWNLGYFVMPISKWINAMCMADYQISQYRFREKYENHRYDMENADENFKDFYVSVPEQSGDLYFVVESYPLNSVPSTCTTGTYTYTDVSGNQQQGTAIHPLLYVALYDASNLATPIQYKYYIEQYHRPIHIKEADYVANKVFKIVVKYLWFNSPHKDYTVSVYSKQDLKVSDELGNNVKLNMNGDEPRGFTDSTYIGNV